MNTYDTPIRTTSAELSAEALAIAEADERAALKAAQSSDAEVVIAQATLDAHLTEIERLAAADLVMLLRHASDTAETRDEIERARLAQAGRRLAAELLEGARRLERYRPNGEIPDYLREGSDVPMLLRRQAD